MYLCGVNIVENTNQNPLGKYFRQPKVYIKLPSQGKFYEPGALEVTETGEYPVFAMTAKDELSMKTPDALFSGEATASIIKSCIPSVIDPWKIVTFDLDYCLIAIRLATYGEKMDIVTTCDHCKTEHNYTIDLQSWMEGFFNKKTNWEINIEGLQVILHPLTYRKSTEHAQEVYKIQKQIQNTNFERGSQEYDKNLQIINKIMANLNLEITISHIHAISNLEEIETDNATIANFLKNTEAKFYQTLTNEVKNLNDHWALPNVNLLCSNEECKKEFTKNVSMDYSNFFVKVS